ncbi:hypothetical protein CCL17_17605 [Pseudomonas congelans]|uniref:hypothetical protein n=1 Tax=Pseudomonas congelans TaxID=200452 RepID=UPI000BB64B6E|nr:hypothetical protein [Pseudomonas congelans]PBP99750.1 hypothetical protein CCL17_17605 [Pseudomonas congelans]
MPSSGAVLSIMGPVIAAMIAGAIAFIVSVLTKENKTSEFRQAWIENLRNDVAELLSETNILSGMFEIDVVRGPGDRAEASRKFWRDHRSELAKITAAHNRIVLRLNAAEHLRLISKLQEVERSHFSSIKKNGELCDEVTAEVAIILKAEWERVKQGENTFRQIKRCAKWVFLVTSGLMLLVLVVWLLSLLFWSYICV